MRKTWIIVYEKLNGSYVVFKIITLLISNDITSQDCYDIENIEVMIKDKDKVILLLRSLLISFENFKSDLIFVIKGTIT